MVGWGTGPGPEATTAHGRDVPCPRASPTVIDRLCSGQRCRRWGGTSSAGPCSAARAPNSRSPSPSATPSTPSASTAIPTEWWGRPRTGPPCPPSPPPWPSRACRGPSRYWVTTPTIRPRDQLSAALDQVGPEFPASVVAVMLASVADGGMPASDLCFDIVATDGRFGLVDWSEIDAASAPAPARRRRRRGKPTGGLTPEQRQARRLKKQRDAEERRAKMEAARRAGDQVRQARKRERSQSGVDGDRRARCCRPRYRRRRAPADPTGRPHARSKLEEFDRDDPWVAGRGLRLGAVRRRPNQGSSTARSALCGGGRLADPSAGPSRVLPGRVQEPGLEIGTAPPLEEVRIRPADLDRASSWCGSNARRIRRPSAGSRPRTGTHSGSDGPTAPATPGAQCIAPCNPLPWWHASQELRRDELLGGPDPRGGGRVVDHADRQGLLPRDHQVRRFPRASRDLPQHPDRPPRPSGRSRGCWSGSPTRNIRSATTTGSPTRVGTCGWC